MWDYSVSITEDGVIGMLPTGEQKLFKTEEEYAQAYKDEEDMIYDGMAEAFCFDEVLDYAEY